MNVVIYDGWILTITKSEAVRPIAPSSLPVNHAVRIVNAHLTIEAIKLCDSIGKRLAQQ